MRIEAYIRPLLLVIFATCIGAIFGKALIGFTIGLGIVLFCTIFL